jgi:hypothetical protein
MHIRPSRPRSIRHCGLLRLGNLAAATDCENDSGWC